MSLTMGLNEPTTVEAALITPAGMVRTRISRSSSRPEIRAISCMLTGRSHPMSIRSPSTPGTSTASARQPARSWVRTKVSGIVGDPPHQPSLGERVAAHLRDSVQERAGSQGDVRNTPLLRPILGEFLVPEMRDPLRPLELPDLRQWHQLRHRR